jgi:tRNA U34 5-carboxymethylaminomethyl modifying enzyme MnmG/GidA
MAEMATHFPDQFGEFAGDRRLEERLKVEGFYGLFQQRLDNQSQLLRENERALLPPDIDYWRLKELSMEARYEFDFDMNRIKDN